MQECRIFYFIVFQEHSNATEVESLVVSWELSSAMCCHASSAARLCRTPSGVVTWRTVCSVAPAVVFDGKDLWEIESRILAPYCLSTWIGLDVT